MEGFFVLGLIKPLLKQGDKKLKSVKLWQKICLAILI